MRFDLAINGMAGKAACGHSIEVFGGDQWRPFIHVKDAAHAFVLAAETHEDITHRQIFNVGDNDSNYQIKQIAAIIKNVIPETEVEISLSNIDQRNYNVIFDKINEVLGFNNVQSLEESIISIKQDVQNNHINIHNDIFHNVHIWKKLIEKRKFIPFCLPYVGEDEKSEVLNTIDSNWLSTGPKTKTFESRLLDYFNCPGLHVIPVSSCTAALHLQLIAAGIGPGSEVITTPLTFCSTINTILYTGAKPVFVDIDSENYNIDINKISKKITGKTKAIVPVYFSGQPIDHDSLRKITKQNKIYILADAAHALGSKYKDSYTGTYEDAASFSLYAIKNITTGEGGIVTTKNEEWASKIRNIASLGMNRDAWQRYGEKGSWYYEITSLGYKYNFTDIQAAFGLHQLKKINYFNKIRSKYADIYDQEFSDIPELIIPKVESFAKHNRHLYPLLIDNEKISLNRDRFADELSKFNIGCSVHYVPIYKHPFYKKNISINPGDFPVTEWYYNRAISIPLYPKMRIEEVHRVARIIKDIVQKYVN